MHVAVLDPSDPGTATFNVTSDAAAGAVRPAVHAPYLRARWAVVDSGDGNSSHTFSVVGWGQGSGVRGQGNKGMRELKGIGETEGAG